MSIVDNLTTKAVSYIAVAIIVPLLAYSIYAFFHINSIETDLAQLSEKHVTCKLSKAGLEAALDKQNKKVESFLKAQERLKEGSKIALLEAKRTNSALQDRLNNLKSLNGKGCAAVEDAIDGALGL